MVLRLALAGAIAGVVQLLHLGLAEATAVRLLDTLGQRVHVGPGGLQRPLDGVRGRDDLALLVEESRRTKVASLAAIGASASVISAPSTARDGCTSCSASRHRHQ